MNYPELPQILLKVRGLFVVRSPILGERVLYNIKSETLDTIYFSTIRFYDERDAEEALAKMDGARVDGRELRSVLPSHFSFYLP